MNKIFDCVHKHLINGLISIERDGKLGFVDRTGKIVAPCIYDVVESFSEGLAYVVNNDGWHFIYKNGKVVI